MRERFDRGMTGSALATVLAAAFLTSMAVRPAMTQQVEGGIGVTLANTSVTASDRQVNVRAGGRVTLTTILPLPARETIVLKDLKGTIVRTLVDTRRARGTYVDAWDGKGDRGKRLKDDQYRWVAILSDG